MTRSSTFSARTAARSRSIACTSLRCDSIPAPASPAAPMGRGCGQRRVPRPVESIVRDDAARGLNPRLTLVPVFDLDGTLIDSDAGPCCSVRRARCAAEQITFGHTLAVECDRLGLVVDDYLDRYDDQLAQPFPEVEAPWPGSSDGRCARTSTHEAAAPNWRGYGWTPEVVMFADSFNGPKELGPVLDALAVRRRGDLRR